MNYSVEALDAYRHKLCIDFDASEVDAAFARNRCRAGLWTYIRCLPDRVQHGDSADRGAEQGCG